MFKSLLKLKFYLSCASEESKMRALTRKVLLLETSYLLRKKYLTNQSIYKRFQVHPIATERRTYGEFHHLHSRLLKFPEKFTEYYRMSKETFEYILEQISPLIEKNTRNQKVPIDAEERLSLTIRYLATGNSFRSLAFTYRVGVATVAKIVREVCAAIWKTLASIHLNHKTKDDFLKIADEFYSKWQFPNCIGSIDGKHIRCKCPPHSGSMFYNYKHFFSIVLQAVASADYKFIAIEVGAYGKQSDGGIFDCSTLRHLIETGGYAIPEERNLPQSSIVAPFVMLGDEAYPLKKYLLRPYSKANLNNDTELFNTMLSKSRKTIECAFGLITNKWRLLTKSIETNIEAAELFVKTICLLHNIIINKEGVCNQTLAQVEQNLLRRVNTRRQYNRCSETATNIRNNFKEYFVLKNRT